MGWVGGVRGSGLGVGCLFGVSWYGSTGRGMAGKRGRGEGGTWKRESRFGESEADGGDVEGEGGEGGRGCGVGVVEGTCDRRGVSWDHS